MAPQTFVNPKLLREVDDRLVNSGLFKTVRVRQVDNPDGTCDLRIVVVEKTLWFVFPVFQAWSGRYSGGAAFGESNLFLPNARTLFALQGGNRLSRGFGVFDGRNMFDTNLAVRSWVLIQSDDVSLYEGSEGDGTINVKQAAISVVPGYQWTREIRTSLGFTYRYVDYGEPEGSFAEIAEAGTWGNDVAFEFDFVFDSLVRREALLKGNRLRASFEFADARIGTDFSYHKEEVEWTHARSYWKFLNHVINVSGAIGTQGLPFHQEFTLGGTSLRGFSDRQFRGDTKIVMRQDLLAPVFRHKRFSVFGLAFYDVGLLYLDADTIGRDALHNGVGGGLRVSLKDILAPVFGADFGYGIEEGSFHAYLSLGLVDF